MALPHLFSVISRSHVKSRSHRPPFYFAVKVELDNMHACICQAHRHTFERAWNCKRSSTQLIIMHRPYHTAQRTADGPKRTQTRRARIRRVYRVRLHNKQRERSRDLDCLCSFPYLPPLTQCTDRLTWHDLTGFSSSVWNQSVNCLHRSISRSRCWRSWMALTPNTQR